ELGGWRRVVLPAAVPFVNVALTNGAAVLALPGSRSRGCPMGSATEASAGEDLVRTMAQQIAATTSHAEALRTLRSAFPETPLTLRVAALATLTRRASAQLPR